MAHERICLLVQWVQETQVPSLGWEDPWRGKWQPAPVFLPGKFHGQGSLAGYGPWGSKESDWLRDWACAHAHARARTHTHTHTHTQEIHVGHRRTALSSAKTGAEQRQWCLVPEQRLFPRRKDKRHTHGCWPSPSLVPLYIQLLCMLAANTL